MNWQYQCVLMTSHVLLSYDDLFVGLFMPRKCPTAMDIISWRNRYQRLPEITRVKKKTIIRGIAMMSKCRDIVPFFISSSLLP